MLTRQLNPKSKSWKFWKKK